MSKMSYGPTGLTRGKGTRQQLHKPERSGALLSGGQFLEIYPEFPCFNKFANYRGKLVMVEALHGVMQSKEYAGDQKRTLEFGVQFCYHQQCDSDLSSRLRFLVCISKASECESFLWSFSALIQEKASLSTYSYISDTDYN